MKSWWSGDSRVEKFMGPVSDAIDRHVPKGDARTDIYNRAYEAVYAAIYDYAQIEYMDGRKGWVPLNCCDKHHFPPRPKGNDSTESS